MAKVNPYAEYGLTGQVSSKKYTKNNSPYASYGADSQGDAVDRQKSYRQQLADKMVKQKAQTKKQADEQVRQQAKQNTAQKIAHLATHNVVTDTAGGIAKAANKTADLPVQTAKYAVGKVTGNKLASVMAQQRAGADYNESLVKPIVDSTVKPLITKGGAQIKHLTSPAPKGKSDQILANQKTASKDPQYSKLVSSVKDIPADSKIKADEMRAKGKSLMEIKSYLTKASKAQQANTKSAVGTAVSIASLGVGGGNVKAAVTASKAAKAGKVAETAIAGGVGNEGATLSTNPNASAKELSDAGATGLALGTVAEGGGMAIGKLTRKPDLTAEKVATGQQAMDTLTVQKEKLTTLKRQHPNAPELDKAIQNVDKKIVEVQKTSDKQAIETQKTTEKNAAEVKKIDQQTELIQAKKKDTGKTSAVDTVKLKQLKERKAEIQSESPVVSSESPVVYAKPQTTPAKEPTTPIKATTTKVPDTTSGSASRVYQRLKAEHPDLTEDVSYQATTLKKDAEKAVSVLAEDKQKAFRIATGQETSPDVTSTSTNIAMAEKALQEGNHKLYARLVKSRSLDQTRRGQELVAEKGSITDNSTSRYVKELIGIKLDKVGKQYLGDVRDRMGQTSSKQRATKAIDREVDKLEKQIRNRRLDTKTALALLDKIECQ